MAAHYSLAGVATALPVCLCAACMPPINGCIVVWQFVGIPDTCLHNIGSFEHILNKGGDGSYCSFFSGGWTIGNMLQLWLDRNINYEFQVLLKYVWNFVILNGYLFFTISSSDTRDNILFSWILHTLSVGFRQSGSLLIWTPTHYYLEIKSSNDLAISYFKNPVI